MKLLVICGPSGSGKSVLEKSLIDKYPRMFNKLPQMTTREIRSNESFGNPYVFVNTETFEFMRNKLIGRIVSKDSMYRNQYGTIPNIEPDKINTLILSEEAIIDLLYQMTNRKTFFKDKERSEINLLIIGLDIDYNELNEEAKNVRYDRTRDFLNKEKSVFNLCHQIFKNSKDKFLSADELYTYLQEIKYI